MTASPKAKAFLLGLLSLSSWLLGSCATWKAAPPAPERVAELSQQLRAAAPKAPKAETDRLAQAAHDRSYELAKQYGVFLPAWAHNCLINTHAKVLPFRKPMRGLCYQWAHDMGTHLAKVPHPHFELRWGVHAKGELFDEHNCVILTAKGKPMKAGVVLDPWRFGGNLYHGPVAADSKYRWEEEIGWTAWLQAGAEPYL